MRRGGRWSDRTSRRSGGRPDHPTLAPCTASLSELRPTNVRAIRGYPDGTEPDRRRTSPGGPLLSGVRGGRVPLNEWCPGAQFRPHARASTSGNSAWVRSSPVGADSLVIHFTKLRVLRKGAPPGRAGAAIYRKASRSLAKPPVEPCAGAANCAVWTIACPAPSATQ
jgi:hypothetical protein